MTEIMRFSARKAERKLRIVEIARLVWIVQQRGAAAFPIAPGLRGREPLGLVVAVEPAPVRFDHVAAFLLGNMLEVDGPAFGEDPRGAAVESLNQRSSPGRPRKMPRSTRPSRRSGCFCA